MGNSTFPEQSPLIPWTWSVTPSLTTSHCPTPTSILLTFAVVNILVSISGLIFGWNQWCIWLSCGRLTRERGYSWLYMWLVSVALQLTANVSIALLMKRTAGIDGSRFSVGDIVLFFTTRPRLSWIVMSIVFPTRPGGRGGGNRDYEPGDVIYDGPWQATARQTLIAEAILQIMGAYYMGRTANFAASRGYYREGSLKGFGQQGYHARLMYTGALVFLVLLPFNLFGLVVGVGSSFLPPVADGAGLTWVGMVLGSLIALTLGTGSWIGSWLFWAGYVHLAGDSYCPPKLTAQGAILIVFSVLGITVGSA